MEITMRHIVLLIFIGFGLLSCRKYNPQKQIDTRNFKMGFSTWSFGPDDADKEATYDFINSSSDIRSVQMDDKIPWNAWINSSPLPASFVADVDYHVSKLNPDHELVLSISPLNTGRTDLMEDWETGNIPSYAAINDQTIISAYLSHTTYLIEAFNPDYLIIAMESNDFLINSSDKWIAYRAFISEVTDSLKSNYPNLEIAESITLHNWYDEELTSPEGYFKTVKSLISEQDFAAISFYPFFLEMKTHRQYQKAFDFLHQHVSKPIAFVETAQISQDLDIPALGLNREGSEKIQHNYLESLLVNAHHNNYKFVIWWSHRDYDKLWETLPDNQKDLSKIWRNTGLLEADGKQRKSMLTWGQIFLK